MSYDTTRKHEIRSQNIRLAKELVKEYDPNKKTIILLPGGLGSQLERSRRAYNENNPVPFDIYDTVWIDLGIIFERDALTLEIKSNGHDKGNRIVIPNGPLRFFVKPYDGTKRFFVNQGYNYAVYGFDWRRPLLESAMWFEDFLRRFRSGVIARFGNDESKNPLTTTTFICHSHGGLVAALFLQRVFSRSNLASQKISQWMEKVITIGTPFYANATHIKRYYNGEKALNIIHGAMKITRVAATLPGPYIFLFLDKDTYVEDGAKLGLTRYPVTDMDDDFEVDPYEAATLGRYPKWIEADFLQDAKNERKTLRRELPKPVRDRVFHIRSGLIPTGVEWKWKNIDGGNFDPENDQIPILNINGPGDGTVPAWAARLAQIPDSQVYDLKKADDHTSLLEHEGTLNVIRFIVEKGRCPVFIPIKDKKYIGVKKASRPSVENFLLGVKEKRVNIKDDIATDPRIWRGVMEDINLC